MQIVHVFIYPVGHRHSQVKLVLEPLLSRLHCRHVRAAEAVAHRHWAPRIVHFVTEPQAAVCHCQRMMSLILMIPLACICHRFRSRCWLAS